MLCNLGSHYSPNHTEYERAGTTATHTVKASGAESRASASADGGAE